LNGAPRITGVIPVRDRAGLVGRSIESVLAQRGPSFELIVFDDGSTDATPAVLSGYGERILAVRQPPTGRSAARNAGIERARGEWIAFLDSDDAWLPGKLARQLAYHEANPGFAMSAHGVERVHPDGRVEPAPPDALTGDAYLSLADHFAFVPSAVMVRSDVAREVGGFDANFDGTEDLDFALRVAAKHPVAVMPDCLTRYHLHDAQTGRRRLAGGNARVLRAHLERETDATRRAHMRRKLARYLVSSAKRAETAAQRRAFLDEAAAVDPKVRLRAAWLRQRFGLGGSPRV
jgi:glycosyltransferase involved in cell wall biosynthesis